MVSETATFESLPMRRRSIAAVSHEDYVIISKGGEIKQVKANTAYEAFKLSGVEDAIRIERRAVSKEVVLPKSRFTDAVAPQAMGDAMDTIGYGSVVRQRSPVVTAQDLDMMMRSFQTAETAMIPDGLQAQETQRVTNPTGVEIHGDGFDELIPATPTHVHVGTTKHVTTLTEAQASLIDTPSPTELPPEQELSAEEVNKLLNG